MLYLHKTKQFMLLSEWLYCPKKTPLKRHSNSSKLHVC